MDVAALLPGWVLAGPWLVGPVLGVTAALAVRLVVALKRGWPAEAHWTEQARVAHPLRTAALTARTLSLLLAFLFLASTRHAWVGGPHALRALFTLAAAWLPPTVALLAAERRLRPVSLAEVARSQATFLVLLFPGVVIFVVAIALLLRPFPLDWVFALLAWGLAVLGSAGRLIPLGVHLGLARPAGERVQTIVARTAAGLGRPPPHVVEVDLRQANAFAFQLVNTVAVTRSLPALLDDEELGAIAAHELGHLHEPLALRLQRPLISAAALAAGFALALGLITSTRDLLVALGCVGALLLLARRAARRGETHADTTAHQHSTSAHDSAAYARALEKVYAANLVPAVLRRPGPHGHLYDRLLAAGLTPAWARPAPPPRGRLEQLPVFALVLLTAFVSFGRLDARAGAAPAQWRLALGDGSSRPLLSLAGDAVARARFQEAATFARAAGALAPGDPEVTAYRTMVLAVAGHCTEAEASFRAHVESAPDRGDLHEGLRPYLDSCLPR